VVQVRDRLIENLFRRKRGNDGSFAGVALGFPAW